MKDASLKGDDNSVCAVIRFKFREDLADMIFYGRFGYSQDFAYLAIAASRRHESDDPQFLRTQV